MGLVIIVSRACFITCPVVAFMSSALGAFGADFKIIIACCSLDLHYLYCMFVSDS